MRRIHISPLNPGRLRKSLEEIFPATCFLPGLKVAENRRVFSISLAQGEGAIGIQIDHNAMNWRADQPRCDALFVCWAPGSDSLAIVFVELKGGDVEKAMDQIEESAKALCKKPGAVRDVHTTPVIDAVKSLCKQGHGKGIVGVIVSKKSIPIDQQRRKRLRKQGIILWAKTGQLRDITCRKLAEKSLPIE